MKYLIANLMAFFAIVGAWWAGRMEGEQMVLGFAVGFFGLLALFLARSAGEDQ